MADINQELTSPAPTSPAETPTRSRRKAPPALPQDDVAHSAASRLIPARVARAIERCQVCARIADDNRAKDILLLDLREATPLIDFFVIASANSRRQAYAIASEIDQGAEEGRWILVDYGDFVIHVFSEDARTYYALEEIWGDAPRIEWRDPARIRTPAPVEEAPDRPIAEPDESED